MQKEIDFHSHGSQRNGYLRHITINLLKDLLIVMKTVRPSLPKVLLWLIHYVGQGYQTRLFFVFLSGDGCNCIGFSLTLLRVIKALVLRASASKIYLERTPV